MKNLIQKITSKAFNLALTIALLTSSVMPANARILFQVDDNSTIESEGLIINSDDGGDEDVTLQFGNDLTDAIIRFDDGTGDLIFSNPSGIFDFSGGTISNLADPISDQEAATKYYVDSLVNGLSWKDPIEHSNQLEDGGIGVGGIRAGGMIQVTDETLVLDGDTIAITYNSGGSTITLTARDIVSAACDFSSGVAATSNDDMAISILAALDNAGCANAPAFSGQSIQIDENVFIVHDTVGTTGNGSTVASGSGLMIRGPSQGRSFASLVAHETRVTQSDSSTYTWDSVDENWVQISGVNSIPYATTTFKGTVELATDGENAANVVVQGNDSRLHDQNTDTGTSEDTFNVNSNGDDATIQFGQNSGGELFFDDSDNSFNVDNNRIVNLADPTSDSDAATKNYVDDNIIGLDWQDPLDHDNQLVDGGAGTGGIRAGGTLTVSDETVVLDGDTIAINYNSGGSTITLTARDTVSLACDFESGLTATDNTDMATSILAAIDNAGCTDAPAFSGQSTSSGASVFLVHDTASTVGNGTVTASGAGFMENDISNGTAFASLTPNETHLTVYSGASYSWSSDDEVWNQISTGGEPDATTTTKGVVELATDGENAANVVVQGNDGRLHYQNTDTGSSANTYTLDSDDTGGNIVLKFGTALAETLTWDNANTRWTFSDDIRVEGNAAIVGIAYIADDHAATDTDGTINLGRNGGAWETLMWDDSSSQFEISDELNIGGTVTSTGNIITSGGTLQIGTTELSATGGAGANGATLIGVDNTEFTHSSSTNVQDTLDDFDTYLHTQNTDTGSTTNTFTLDSDDTGGNVVLRFGTSLAKTLTWDNTNTQWAFSDDVTIGSGAETISNVAFSPNGNDMFIAGDLGVEGQIYTDATATKYMWLDILGGSTTSATIGTVNSSTSPVIRFDGGNDSRVTTAFPVPDDWQSGSDIEVEVFWSPEDATAGNAYFTLEYQSWANGETISGSTTLTSTQAAPGTTLKLARFTFTIPAAALAANDMVNIRLNRLPGNVADTYAGDTNVHMVRINYTGKKLQ